MAVVIFIVIYYQYFSTRILFGQRQSNRSSTNLFVQVICMRTMDLKKGRFARFPIILFTVALPLLFVYSFKTVIASAPIAVDDAYTTLEDTAWVEIAPGVLGNDSFYVGGIAVLETDSLTGTVDLADSGAFT